MRRDLHARRVGRSGFRPEVIEEAPRADASAGVRMRQQPAHHRVPTERHVPTLQQVTADGDGDIDAALALGRPRSQIAHRSTIPDRVEREHRNVQGQARLHRVEIGVEDPADAREPLVEGRSG